MVVPPIGEARQKGSSYVFPIINKFNLNKLIYNVKNIGRANNFTRGKERRINPEDKRLSILKGKLPIGTPEWRVVRTQMRSVPSKMMMDNLSPRMYYVRYADNFVVGLQGTHKEAQ
ncbi:hypothetical protein, partial [Agrobacterium sp.]|uniref:hypothetical protein n=1 Tax=Agrobacterium sp. TaxID=361 RepID=UPI0040348475